MRDDNYILIQAWMCNELKLKGNDLLIYALIHGFSQDGESRFSGSRKYIADTFNISLPTVDKAIKNLLDKELIEQHKIEKQGITFNTYNSLYPVKKLYRGSKETLPNNIINNTRKEKEFISKDINSTQNFGTEFNFGWKQPKRLNLYNQCLAYVDAHIDKSKQETLRLYLIDYLQFRISVKEKPLYINMWKGMIDKLLEFPKNQQIDIVKQSIELGYLSFYSLKSKSNNKIRLSEPTHGTGCEQPTEEEERQRAEFIQSLREQGKRADF